ncbi:MAG: hypothetical protein JOY58_13480 [Solirubrobacterales bacterium]|nr:hypothetical protein [Solirubrobacterales bacterium]
MWAGMGGSGVTVGVLADLEADGARAGPAVHLLDSTDPVAIDALVARLASGKNLPIDRALRPEDLHALLGDVVLVAVSMGVTSEEPATHLSWFLGLLATARLAAAHHAVVLTVPGSRLAQAAEREGLDARPVFLGNRGGLPGRMSAPGTSVFLLPVALRGERLGDVLGEAWSAHDLGGTIEHPHRSPYVRLALELAARTHGERARLMLGLPRQWAPLHVWIEQLFEQTLGKDGKGVVVLEPQQLNRAAVGYRDDDLIVATARPEDELTVPSPDPSLSPHAALAAAMLGWQLVTALLSYRFGTNVVDEPAVEDYKARARALRAEADVLERAIVEGAVDWAVLGAEGVEPLAAALVREARAGGLSYLDLTINGELDENSRSTLRRRLQRLGNDLLGVPVKLRRAPAAYHVSEQCQLDGPPGVVSLRVVARETRSARLGGYTPRYLHAQAVATWQAMTGRGRDCMLVVLERLEEVSDVLWAAEELVQSRIGGRVG